MATFLDLNSSMNSNQNGFPDAVLTTTPSLFGVIGLVTQGVTNPIVTMSGVVGVSSSVENSNDIIINVLRGTTTFAPESIIYTAIASQPDDGTDLLSFEVQDLVAPAAVQTIYSAFVSATGGTAVRTGPEVFYGIAAAR